MNYIDYLSEYNKKFEQLRLRQATFSKGNCLQVQLLFPDKANFLTVQDKQEILTKNPVDVHSDSNSVAPNILSNPNLDLTEIIKSFPVDKLRELLSGVQITINITFPTKKQ